MTSAAAAPWTTDDLKSAPVLDPTGWLEDFHELAPKILAGEEMFVHALGPDGRLLVSIGRPNRALEDNFPSRLALLDRSGRPDLIERVEDPEEPVVNGAAVSRDWVVWAESTTNDLFTNPFVLYAHDRHTGVTKEIARAPRYVDMPTPTVPNGTTPVIIGGDVYFTTIASFDGKKLAWGIARVPADGSAAAEMVIPGGATPFAVGKTLTYEVADWGFVNWKIHSRSVDSGTEQDVVMAQGKRRIYGYAIAGDSVVWADRSSKGHQTFIGRAGSQPEPVGTHGGGLNFRDGAGRFVFGVIGQRVFVLDSSTGAIRRFDDDRLQASPLVNGRWITWRVASGPDKGKQFVGRVPR